MKMKMHIAPITHDDIKFEGATIELEYEVGEIANIMQVQLPAIKELITQISLDLKPYFDRAMDIRVREIDDRAINRYNAQH